MLNGVASYPLLSTFKHLKGNHLKGRGLPLPWHWAMQQFKLLHSEADLYYSKASSANYHWHVLGHI